MPPDDGADESRDEQSPETIVTLPLGNAGVHFAGRPNTESLIWGPTALAVAPDGSFLIADAVVTRILQFGRDGSKGPTIDLRGKVVGIADLAVTDRSIYVLDLSAVTPRVIALARDGSPADSHVLPAGLGAEATGLAIGRQGELEVELGAGRYQLLDAQGALDPRPAPGPRTKPEEGDDILTVAGRPLRGRSRDADVSYRFLGELGTDFVVVAAEARVDRRRNAIRVEQMVSRHDERGETRGVAPAPTPFIPVPNGLAVGADGNIYALTTRPDGAVVQRLRWA
jgi:hypothetical protein